MGLVYSHQTQLWVSQNLQTCNPWAYMETRLRELKGSRLFDSLSRSICRLIILLEWKDSPNWKLSGFSILQVIGYEKYLVCMDW